MALRHFLFPLAAAGLCLGLLGAPCAQAEEAVAPTVDLGALPPIAAGWAELNPYRKNAGVAAIGREVFNQACARCHGVDANGSRSPAPDLRRIGRACLGVREEALRQRCLSDADHHFVSSVRQGKVIFGITHMPPWEGVLEPSAVWALRTFIETAPR